jgi:superoxide dismutase, Cu-Zn family
MKRVLLIVAFVMVAIAVQVASVSATHWCGGAYDPKLGTSFGSCPGPAHPGVTSSPPAAGVTLKDSSGRVVGSAVLLQKDDGVRILLDLTGATPGTKAVHIHEVGRCDAPNFDSAGAHFNPKKAEHGTENPRGPHAGDLPNITVDATGRGHLEVTDPRVTLEPGSASLLDGGGTALVVHEGPDDMRTDPAGNSGPRTACGVIVRGG